ncbi:uncharacterized protein LOC144820318 [Lissotriton helveticus]
MILQRFQENHLFAKLEKCLFHTQKVDILGFVISPEGIHMDPAKVSAITSRSSPKTVKEVQSFLDFGNFHRRFIDHFSDLITPTTRLLKKGVVFDWINAAEKVFHTLKNRFTSAPIIRHADDTQPYYVKADASQYAVGGVLS